MPDIPETAREAAVQAVRETLLSHGHVAAAEVLAAAAVSAALPGIVAAVREADGPVITAEAHARTISRLRRLADGRREYAHGAPEEMRRMLLHEADILDAATQAADGDEHAMKALLPSWRWNDDEATARQAGGDPVTDLNPYRVLITGSRSWTDEQAIRDALASIIGAHGPENVIVVHGACPQGADEIADQIATAWGGGLTVERHPADWNGPAGRGAGFARNAEMVRLGADVCLAFVDPCTKPKCREPKPHGSHGASHTADLAEKAGILTHRFPERTENA